MLKISLLFNPICPGVFLSDHGPGWGWGGGRHIVEKMIDKKLKLQLITSLIRTMFLKNYAKNG